MKRILLMILRNILLVPPAWIRLCWYASHVERYTEEKIFEFLKYIVRRANKGGNIVIDISGTEHIPEKNGFIYYSNHQGLYDVLAIVHASPVPLSMVAKKEVAGVPFLKQVIACVKGYTLDREDVKQGMQVILNVAKEVKAGRNYLIFPEGTRSKNGNTLLEFKGGSFKAAMKAKSPIVPVALIDSYKSFDTGSVQKLKVQVHFLKPMYYEEYKDLKSVEIAEEVKHRIEMAIQEHTTVL